MLKKIAIGFLAVVIVCGVARSGYAFGKYLAQKDNARSESMAVGAPPDLDALAPAGPTEPPLVAMPYALLATLLVSALSVHFMLRADAFLRTKTLVGIAWLLSVLIPYLIPQWALAGTLLQVMLVIGLLLHAKLHARDSSQP